MLPDQLAQAYLVVLQRGPAPVEPTHEQGQLAAFDQRRKDPSKRQGCKASFQANGVHLPCVTSSTAPEKLLLAITGGRASKMQMTPGSTGMRTSSLTAQNSALTKLETETVPLWQVLLLAALAGGMGWGIRGQYGHETGAMIAGLLVGLVLVLLLCPSAASLQAARPVGLCAAAIGFGGAMTYGQTVGLTHNPELVGNWAALGWGMLGLSIKGALWIGFAGVFLGMGLSGVRYHPGELAMVLGGLLLFMLLGIWALNLPFDPASRSLPRIYFSADWAWYSTAGEELKPRREFWGGFLLALAGLVFYAGCFRKDRLARNMAFWGCLGGLGFPIGQSLQAWHAWNRDLFREGWLAHLDKVINWWNFMEITFGLVLGAVLGLGLWLNRRIAALDGPGDVTITPAVE